MHDRYYPATYYAPHANPATPLHRTNLTMPWNDSYWSCCSGDQRPALSSPSGDITDLIFRDKADLMSATARMIQSQINARTTMMNENIAELDERIVAADNYRLEIENISDFVSPLVESRRASLSNEASRLEAEKRKELVSWWGDTIKLYSELMNILGDYRALSRKSELLRGDDHAY